MEAACAPGEVVAIQDDNGQLTIIHFEAAPSEISASAGVQVDSEPHSQTVPGVLEGPTPNQGNEQLNLDERIERQEAGSNSSDVQLDLPGDLIEIKNEVSIQANDYEIERATGILPARKRFIPLKYRDFRSPDEIEKDDEHDSDYEPEPLVQPKEPKKKRGRGRPRKYPEGKADTEASSETKKLLMMRTPNGYKCLTCNHVFSQKGNLKVHLLTHTNERPWRCDIDNCDKGFRTKESLRRHKLSHMGIKPFECSECKKKFCSAFSLQEHMSLHNNERPYTCSECQRAFRQISCLRRHLLTHSSEMPHACSVCNRRFSQAVYLRSHMKVHTGEKPFSCDQCNKSFAHASDLTRHKIIHSGSKPYSCSVCSMRFSDPSSRRRHEREHIGTKAYTCHLCSEGFKRASQLRAHLFRRHGGLKEGVEFQIQEGPEPVCYRIELHESQAEGSDVASSKTLDLSALDQKKIISLIQNLNRNVVVQEVEVASGEVMDVGAPSSEGEVANTITSEIQTTKDIEQMILPVEVATTMEEGGEDSSSVITIAKVGTDDMVQDLGSSFQILHETESEKEAVGQPVYEVHYHPIPSSQTCTSATALPSENSTTTPPSSSLKNNSPQVTENKSPHLMATTTSAPDSASFPVNSTTVMYLNSDFVSSPDFGSQEYYDWLSSFTEVCKTLSMPLEVELFHKISQVHKSLSDFMASPHGVISDKENFKILMSISKDLGCILDGHLKCMLQNLSQATPQM